MINSVNLTTSSQGQAIKDIVINDYISIITIENNEENMWKQFITIRDKKTKQDINIISEMSD